LDFGSSSLLTEASMKKILLLFALSVPLSLAQTVQLTQPVQPPGNPAPVTFTGQVACYPSPKGITYEGNVTIANSSTKKIVAYSFTVKAQCPGATVVSILDPHDMYFKSTIFSPGDTFPTDINFPMPANPAATASYLTVQPQFVQFEDGSVWGDQNVANDTFTKRQAVKLFLRKLTTLSDADFLITINDSTLGRYAEAPVARGLRTAYDQGGIGAAKQMVTGRLATAAARTF
jgi:hypothetical protein